MDLSFTDDQAARMAAAGIDNPNFHVGQGLSLAIDLQMQHSHERLWCLYAGSLAPWFSYVAQRYGHDVAVLDNGRPSLVSVVSEILSIERFDGGFSAGFPHRFDRIFIIGLPSDERVSFVSGAFPWLVPHGRLVVGPVEGEQNHISFWHKIVSPELAHITKPKEYLFIEAR